MYHQFRSIIFKKKKIAYNFIETFLCSYLNLNGDLKQNYKILSSHLDTAGLIVFYVWHIEVNNALSL